MIPHRASLANHLHPPKVRSHAVQERSTRCNSKAPGGVEGDEIAEIEECSGYTAENDGEFKPGEEGAFGSEENFGLDADGDVDSCGENEGQLAGVW